MNDKELMTMGDFLDFYNYMINSEREDQSDEVLKELNEIVKDMMQLNTGMVVPFKFKNKKGQIELV